MTLKSLISDQVSSVFLDTDHFAESLTYTPRSGGSPRTITGIVDHEESPTQNDDELTEKERITLFVEKDDSSGITDPQLGDTITWNGNLYAFGGEIEDEDAAAWTLVFERNAPFRTGGRQTMDR